MNSVLHNITVFLLRAISKLPFGLIYLLSDILFLILFYVTGYRRKVVKMNLTNAFPEKTDEERSVIERQFYRFLSDIILESVKSISITAEELDSRYRYENLDELRRHLDGGRKLILVSGHYGNWEWGAFSIGRLLNNPVIMVYKPLSNTRFDKLVFDIRSRFGTIMVPMKQTLRAVSQYSNVPHVLGLAGDQTPSLPESNYFTRFLNQDTAVFQGIEKIAVKSDYVVGFMSVRPKKRGYYSLEFQTLTDQAKSTTEHEITDLHTRALENLIRERPQYWLWSHRRWKVQPKDVHK